MKTIVKKCIPKSVISLLHKYLTLVAARKYGFPARKMIIIGVTGTNGKSTTVHLIAHLLESAGYKVGYTTTVDFKVGETTWLNTHKMTMLGRSNLQILLSRMVREGCQYAIIETSSEGLSQNRHAGIDYDVAVFTNLTPEHLESHGSFERYKRAKGLLFSSLQRSLQKSFTWKSPIPKIIVANLDDLHAAYYLNFWAERKYGFSHVNTHVPEGVSPVVAHDVSLGKHESSFTIDGIRFSSPLVGMHNVENLLAAIAVAKSQDIPLTELVEPLTRCKGVPGRMEWIDEGQSFQVLIDYAPEPASLASLYATIQLLYRPSVGRVIHVLGSAGGGRDKSRRPILGEMAGSNADVVIVTNEDPYDENPSEIIEQVAQGARTAGKVEGRTLFTIEDRKEAIYKALTLATVGDLVILTGKGAEQAIMTAGGSSIPWDEREVVRTLLKTLGKVDK